MPNQVKLVVSAFPKGSLHVYGLLCFDDKKIELTRTITEVDLAAPSFEGYQKYEKTIRFWKVEDLLAQAERYCKRLFKEYKLEVVYDN